MTWCKWCDLHDASQLRHAGAPVNASIHQLLGLHIIGHLALEIDPPLAVAGASKVLGAAGNERDCEGAAKQSQGALLPEAMDEGDDPAAALQSLTQGPAWAHIPRLHALWKGGQTTVGKSKMS